jgi:metal-sulfur cluster biosynthetic enzyme
MKKHASNLQQTLRRNSKKEANRMGQQLEQAIYKKLEYVIDPELHVDIVNLGLIYGIDIDEENNVEVTMTMTSMGCPVAGEIVSEVKFALVMMEELNGVEVKVVWTPAWTKARMSRYAKIALGVTD